MKVLLLIILCFQSTFSVEGNQQSGIFKEVIEVAPKILANERTGLIDTDYRWTNNIVPYEVVDLTSAQAAYVREVLDEMEASLCLTFVSRTTEPNYIQVVYSESGCSSNVGMIGGVQQLELETDCFEQGTIMFLFLTSLGIRGMHRAPDRDKYVEIIWENIEPGYDDQFHMVDPDKYSQFGVPYDYGSIMHFSATEFSHNGQPTIVPRDPNAVIGQSEKMSLYDIQRIRNMYCP